MLRHYKKLLQSTLARQSGLPNGRCYSATDLGVASGAPLDTYDRKVTLHPCSQALLKEVLLRPSYVSEASGGHIRSLPNPNTTGTEQDPEWARQWCAGCGWCKTLASCANMFKVREQHMACTGQYPAWRIEFSTKQK